MDSEPSQRIASALLRRAGTPADSSRIAAAVVDLWNALHATLSPLIGPAGVGALYQRSLQLASRHARCLPPLQGALQAPVDLAALRAALARCSSDVAAADGAALLHTFSVLLADMIGAALAERLLAPVLAEFIRRAENEAVTPS